MPYAPPSQGAILFEGCANDLVILDIRQGDRKQDLLSIDKRCCVFFVLRNTVLDPN